MYNCVKNVATHLHLIHLFPDRGFTANQCFTLKRLKEYLQLSLTKYMDQDL